MDFPNNTLNFYRSRVKDGYYRDLFTEDVIAELCKIRRLTCSRTDSDSWWTLMATAAWMCGRVDGDALRADYHQYHELNLLAETAVVGAPRPT